jgi:pentatricopeptide repeat protein
VLAEERDALRIRALVRLGRLDEARALFDQLRAAYPHSFLLEGVAADVE